MMDSYAAFAPSESEVETFREKLENAKVEQKNLFLVILQVCFSLFFAFHCFLRDSLELFRSMSRSTGLQKKRMK